MDEARDNFDAMSRLFFLGAHRRHHREGVHPDAARPAHLRDDDRHPADPAHALRLRDQFRSEASARRRCSPPTTARTRAASCTRSKNSTYFEFVRRCTTAKPRRTACSRGRGAVRRQHSARISRATCCAAIGHAMLVEADATDPAATSIALAALLNLIRRALHARSQGRLGQSAESAAADRSARPRALQPGGHHPIQHRARADGRDPHHDDGHDHRPRDHPRARARHDGKPARHADAPSEVMHRQDRSLHPHRLRAGRR